MYDVIMCASPISPKKPDESYQEEYDVIKELTTIHLFDIFDVDRLKLPVVESKKLIYHGWMMPPAYYTKFYKNCKAFGYELINTPEQYKACHWFDGWYPVIHDNTPLSIIIPFTDIRTMLEQLMQFKNDNQCAVIIKDSVKSLKHDWFEACFIPKEADFFQAGRVLAKFLNIKETQNDFQGSLIVRKFVDLKSIGTHPKSGMPLSKEYRTFVIDNELLPTYEYWDDGSYRCDYEGPPAYFIEKIADKITAGTGSKLFTIDVAEMKGGEWTCIEVGDGQVSAVPDGVDKAQFFRNLLK